MTLHVIPLDPARPVTALEGRQARYREFAVDAIARHDRVVTRCWRTCWAALTEAAAETGTERNLEAAADALHDMLADQFNPERRSLLATLEDEGGFADRFPCPLTALRKEAVS